MRDIRVEEIVAVTRELRGRARLLEPPFSTRAILDVCFPEVLVMGRTLPDGVDEMVFSLEEGAGIVYKRGLSTPEHRVAIAHGVAHVIWDLGKVQERMCRRHSPVVRIEIAEERAELFMAELLVPLEYLDGYVRYTEPASEEDVDAHLDMIDELASHFQVPVPLLADRVSDLGRRRRAGIRVA
jgi:hypothetical protein